MIVELVPFVSVLCNSSIVPCLQLAEVVANCKKVINGLLVLFKIAYDIVTHVETLGWKLDIHVLLSVIASESFKVDNQNWRHVVQLDLLHSLFVLHAFVAVPSVRLAKIFWLVKLPETVVNTDVISIFLLVTCLKLAFIIPY